VAPAEKVATIPILARMEPLLDEQSLRLLLLRVMSSVYIPAMLELQQDCVQAQHQVELEVPIISPLALIRSMELISRGWILQVELAEMPELVDVLALVAVQVPHLLQLLTLKSSQSLAVQAVAVEQVLEITMPLIGAEL
jgi:hypothetical protein